MRVNAHNRVGVTAEDRSERTDTSVDVTAEEEEEEQKIQQMEKKAMKSSRLSQCLSLRNILTFFMVNLAMMAIVVLSGMCVCVSVCVCACSFVRCTVAQR